MLYVCSKAGSFAVQQPAHSIDCARVMTSTSRSLYIYLELLFFCFNSRLFFFSFHFLFSNFSALVVTILIEDCAKWTQLANGMPMTFYIIKIKTEKKLQKKMKIATYSCSKETCFQQLLFTRVERCLEVVHFTRNTLK